jgi:hypothetical protein
VSSGCQLPSSTVCDSQAVLCQSATEASTPAGSRPSSRTGSRPGSRGGSPPPPGSGVVVNSGGGSGSTLGRGTTGAGRPPVRAGLSRADSASTPDRQRMPPPAPQAPATVPKARAARLPDVALRMCTGSAERRNVHWSTLSNQSVIMWCRLRQRLTEGQDLRRWRCST